jgi:hypothetical protein
MQNNKRFELYNNSKFEIRCPLYCARSPFQKYCFLIPGRAAIASSLTSVSMNWTIFFGYMLPLAIANLALNLPWQWYCSNKFPLKKAKCPGKGTEAFLQNFQGLSLSFLLTHFAVFLIHRQQFMADTGQKLHIASMLWKTFTSRIFKVHTTISFQQYICK